MMEIRVDPQFMFNLASRVDRVASDLERYSRYGACNLSSAPRVAQAYASLGKDWDHKRKGLAKELRALADAIRQSREALIKADRDSAALLDQAE